MKRVVLVTGGARGVGRGIVEAFLPDHDVAFVWNSTEPVDLGGLRIRADLTSEGACADVVAAVMAEFGRLDVIVNNAGLVHMTPKGHFDWAEQRAVLDVNVLVPSALLDAALPHLQAGAAIVNISSVNAQFPPKDAALYGASKAALDLWTRGMAKELGALGVRVNGVAPGAVNLPEAPRSDELVAMFAKETALGRIATPADIARAVRFLASDEASFITGEVLTVSGGYRL